MPEQRGDGKPVRQSVEHHMPARPRPRRKADPGGAALGPDPPANQEDHRRTEQEPSDGSHLAKVARPLGVGVRIHPGQRFSKRDSHDTIIIRYFAPKGRRVRRRQQRGRQDSAPPELSVNRPSQFSRHARLE